MENVKMIERKFIKQLKGIIFFPFKLVFFALYISFLCGNIFFKKSNTRNFIFFKNRRKTY